MAKNWGSVDCQELQKLQESLNGLFFDTEDFCRTVAKELAARFLSGVTKATPVGQYPRGSGKMGGTLRRGWTAASHEQAAGGKGGDNVKAYLNTIEVKKNGDIYTIEIINPVEYASYVEYGHRTRNKKGWVSGKYMMTITENKIRSLTPALLQRRLEQKLAEVLKNGK